MSKHNKEIWKPIEGYPYYAVSDMGRVYVLDKWIRRSGRSNFLQRGKVMNQADARGYKVVTLTPPKKMMKVHRLVAMAFLGESPKGKHIVNHINGTKSDNRAFNLEWVSLAENNQHAHDTGLSRSIPGEKSNLSKLTRMEVYKIRQLGDNGVPLKDIADRYKISSGNAWLIVKRKSWKHLPEQALEIVKKECPKCGGDEGFEHYHGLGLGRFEMCPTCQGEGDVAALEAKQEVRDDG